MGWRRLVVSAPVLRDTAVVLPIVRALACSVPSVPCVSIHRQISHFSRWQDQRRVAHFSPLYGITVHAREIRRFFRGVAEKEKKTRRRRRRPEAEKRQEWEKEEWGRKRKAIDIYRRH